ncbi:tail fiber domain-containing protein [Sphingobacterium rhinopitheci]|uniref:tail fiber domain-containing protein n=1 Tax=Sphingobacterium rhinopitheci TaxID=2781960 RepID=UPI001F5226CB|nr:tail fiber domain-containing protein [Sphingobacterium rhinopitheci]MCI0921293.1 tail fiber domain-containing protein [Sphingobacterium rhinopitheci]
MKKVFILLGLIGYCGIVNAQKIQDPELRLNIKEISNGRELLANLEPIIFDYNVAQFKGLDLPKGKQFGINLNQVKESIPEIVNQESRVVAVSKNTTKTISYEDIDYKSIIPLLVSAVQEQQLEIEKLKSEIEQLKK